MLERDGVHVFANNGDGIKRILHVEIKSQLWSDTKKKRKTASLINPFKLTSFEKFSNKTYQVLVKLRQNTHFTNESSTTTLVILNENFGNINQWISARKYY